MPFIESIAVLHQANTGTFSSGAWRTRALNVVESDPDSIVSLASNQMTLQEGTYEISYSALGYDVAGHLARIYNITDGGEVPSSRSNSQYTNAGEGNQNFVTGTVTLTITGARVFELQHQCFTTSTYTNGFGTGASYVLGPKYATLMIKKYKD